RPGDRARAFFVAHDNGASMTALRRALDAAGVAHETQPGRYGVRVVVAASAPASPETSTE
ncbi:MAG TPA: hypothetical protein VF228_12110, partial [Iamia sp.]